MSVTIDLSGFDKADERLASYAGRELQGRLRRPMVESLELLKRDMADYPPQRPGSDYIRTGTLGRRWTAATPIVRDEAGGGMEGRIGNNTGYGPWVQSERFQAWMHKDRWQTDADVLERNIPRIRRKFEDALR